MGKDNQVMPLREHIAVLTEEKKKCELEITAIRAAMAEGKLRGNEAIQIFDRSKRIKELEKLIPKLQKGLKQQEASKQQLIF